MLAVGKQYVIAEALNIFVVATDDNHKYGVKISDVKLHGLENG